MSSPIAYYNENNKFAAQWLRNLIAGGHIAPGEVDERDIRDIVPNELRGFTQCHFFAGIGVWSYTLRRAGWPDDRPVWTGSCPCQPFSAAGRGEGFTDERHLWPHWFHLISQRRPGVIFGEQVASPNGLAWFDLVQTDLEGTNHAIGGVDICAAGFGSPQIRQRLFWVANARCPEPTRRNHTTSDHKGCREERSVTGSKPSSCRSTGGVADTNGQRPQGQRADGDPQGWQGQDIPATGFCNGAGFVNGFWADAEWLPCTDEKWRPVESGVAPLATSLPAGMGRLCPQRRALAAMAGLDAQSLQLAKSHRVGALRGYGNAINAEVATGFIQAYLAQEKERYDGVS